MCAWEKGLPLSFGLGFCVCVEVEQVPNSRSEDLFTAILQHRDCIESNRFTSENHYIMSIISRLLNPEIDVNI